MFRAIAALVLCLFLAVPVAADPIHTMRTWATALGLPDTVDVQLVEDTGVNGGFFPGGVVCQFVFCMELPPTIWVFAPKDWPREYVLSVLAHEVGHYQQWQEGRLDIMLSVDREWDADTRGVKLMCDLGFNGPELAAEALLLVTKGRWTHQSESHGSVAGRITRLRSLRCGPEFGPEAP